MIRMPAEWERQGAVWIAWPHNLFWPGYRMKLEGTYLRMVELMKTSQIVRIIVPNQLYKKQISQQLNFHRIGHKNVEFYIIDTNDIWIRDYGPTFIDCNGHLQGVKWEFNGYGNRYDFDLDDIAGAKMAEMLEVPIIRVSLVLEGGNIESNGAGTIMLCKSAVLNPSRNPGLTQEDAESILSHYLGAKRIIWLSGLVTENVEKTGYADDTDTHVDTVARFVSENRVVASWTADKHDPAYKLLQKTYQELKEAGLEIIKLPTVKDGYYSTSSIGAGGGIAGGVATRTDASYANFVITNDKVIVPVYGRKEDDAAKEILRDQFPGREVIGLFAGMPAENGGEIHCLTQQEPIAE